MAAFAAAATVVGCSIEPPLERSNPFDPESIYAFSLIGPDSVHSLGEEFALTLVTDPGLPDDDYAILWTAFQWLEPSGFPGVPPIPRTVVRTGVPGHFSVVLPSARYREVSLGAYFGTVAVGHRVWVGQKAVTLSLSCATTVPVPCAAPLPPHSVVRVVPLMHDPRGNALVDPKWAIIRAHVTSRDPAVVVPAQIPGDSAAYVRVRGVGPGTAWVVVDIDGTKDSVSLTFSPP